MRCHTGKARFRHKMTALLALVRIQQEGPKEPGGDIPRRAYRCPHCRGWHLTSMDLAQGEPDRRPVIWVVRV